MNLYRFFLDNAQWLAAGILLTFLSSFGQTFFISIFAGEIRESFGLSHGDWGLTYTIGTSVSAAVMIWAGGLTDIFRTRVIGGIVLAMLSAACLFMALNMWAALLPVVIFALRFTGQGMTSHIAVVSMGRWFVATRGKALSVATLGFSIGEAILPLAFVALMVFVDWRFLWVGAAIVALLAIPVLVRLLKQERTPQSHAETDHATGMLGRHWRRPEMLRHFLFWFMIPALLGPSAFNTAFFFQQVHFAEIKGWSHLELVALFPLYTLAAVSAMMLSGSLLDRFGTARLLPWYQLPMVAAFMLFALGQSLFSALLGLMFLAISAGANQTLPNAFWAEFYGTRSLGAIKAMAAAVMVLGSALGPGITGVLIDAGIGIETQYIGVAAFFVFATVCMVIGVRRAARLL
ncbi:MFS family permease [Sagittula marina]|uniref:MFS family permease n=1 Tax=Sagittula marina TaxID=943940 RepID=A0A7W6GQN6_9RHOB|nr:MFS transporter [Sagittula marina]MBB3983733.1 MFS family permease [Sagittula marina]